MSNLLAKAIEAHGGLERWRQIKAFKADLSITGAIWQFKGQPDIVKQVTLEASTREQWVKLTPFSTPDRACVFEDGHLSLIDMDGQIIECRKEPRAAYVGHTVESQWDHFHAAYFCSYAVWGYFNSPFVYTYPGFVTEELAPWEENGEQWRRLKVTFPDYLASHCREQVSYFGDDGLLRRHDYTVELLGGATGANYALEYQDVDGIKIPTKRRIYAYDAQGDRVDEPLLVAIDVRRFNFI